YVRRALNREPLLVYGDGSQLRDPVHVDDVVNAFTLAGVAAEPRSRVINIGGPHALKLLEIAAILARLSGGSLIQETPFPNCVRQLDIGSYFSDTRRA